MIFISYRRSDGKAIAQLIKQSLIDRGFDEESIFLDLHNLLSEDFVEKCNQKISSCETFILVITKNSFKKREGVDYYWNEIHQALDEGKKIIPILYDATINESIIPEEFKQKKLHLQNALRYDSEYSEASINKLEKAITITKRYSIIRKLSKYFRVPLVFITIYLGVSLLGGIIRYVWDNYWLSDNACTEIALEHIQVSDGKYYYVTPDVVYIYDAEHDTITQESNIYNMQKDGLTINLDTDEIFKIGFWNTAVLLVHEFSKVHIKPHGNPKTRTVIIAATVSIVAGVGFGFVIDRMIFPVQTSKLMIKNVQSVDWWKKIVSRIEGQQNIQYAF